MGNNKFVENMKEAMPEALMWAIVEFLKRMLESGMAVGAAVSACAANFGISEHEAAKFVDKAKKK